MPERTKPTSIDLFCGCGGISAGLQLAGFDVLAGVDLEPNYIATFAHNFGAERALIENLAELSPSIFMRRMNLKKGELDLLSGGPPCQGFSKNVPRKYRFTEDANNLLVLRFLKYAEALQPKTILLENVAEMKNGFSQAYSEEVIGRLEKAGYAVTNAVINAADYGIPQKRRRAFFIGIKGGTPFSFPRATHFNRIAGASLPMLSDSVKRYVSVWDAIGDLPSVPHDDDRETHRYRCAPFSDYQRMARQESKIVSNHKPRTLAETQYQRLLSLRPGQGLKDLPDHLRPKSGYSGAYGRLTKEMIAPTITRWVFHPGSGRFGHPQDIRTITIREAARIQGFADDFEFVGSYTQQAGQIGNAVPPMLARMIGEEIARQAGLFHPARENQAINAKNASTDKRSAAPGIRKRIA